MWQSLRISHLILRLCLAAVFLGLGIASFFYPESALTHFASSKLTYAFGSLEFLIGLGFLANLFVDFFAFLGAVTLIITICLYGFNEAAIQSLGLVGGLGALVFWPSRSFRNY